MEEKTLATHKRNKHFLYMVDDNLNEILERQRLFLGLQKHSLSIAR
jgi:hypothetical protein